MWVGGVHQIWAWPRRGALRKDKNHNRRRLTRAPVGAIACLPSGPAFNGAARLRLWGTLNKANSRIRRERGFPEGSKPGPEFSAFKEPVPRHSPLGTAEPVLPRGNLAECPNCATTSLTRRRLLWNLPLGPLPPSARQAQNERMFGFEDATSPGNSARGVKWRRGRKSRMYHPQAADRRNKRRRS